jgi:hypothetical protein
MPDLPLPDLPYYRHVPTQRRANLQWRLAVCNRAMADAEFRAAIRQMCAEDPLFYINGFGLVFEPRNVDRSKVVPFIQRPKQIENALTMVACWGKKDLTAIKSRGEGFTWQVLWLIDHSWRFQELFTAGLISKDEDAVDTKGDMSTLMPKLDWLDKRLPGWLQVKRERTDLKIINKDNGSTIIGYSATGDAGRSGRTQVFFKDERAAFPKTADQNLENSLQHVTNCQIDGSTPQGDIGVFYEKAHDPEMIKIYYDWKDNPERNRGLYDVKDGEVVEVNPQKNPLWPEQREELADIHRRLELRGFKIEGTRRSPWYNEQCLRSTPVSIAQELDMSFGKSMEKAFSRDTIELLVDRHAKSPVQVGRIKVADDLTASFQAINGGIAKLWCPLGGPDQRPPRRHYCAGVDVATGSGGSWASNSVIVVLDAATGDQVFELATPALRVPDFARMCVAICRWFHDAALLYDAAGPGIIFGKDVIERWGYANVIWSPTLETGPNRTPGKSPGWHRHDDESKFAYLSDCIEDALSDRLIIKSESTLREFGEFGWKNSKITHLKADRTQSEGSKGKLHGDRAIACSMANLVRRELEGSVEPTPEKPPGPNDPLRAVDWACPANRILAHQRQADSAKALRWY